MGRIVVGSEARARGLPGVRRLLSLHVGAANPHSKKTHKPFGPLLDSGFFIHKCQAFDVFVLCSCGDNSPLGQHEARRKWERERN